MINKEDLRMIFYILSCKEDKDDDENNLYDKISLILKQIDCQEAYTKMMNEIDEKLKEINRKKEN